MPKDLEAIKKRTEERHILVHKTFKHVYRKHKFGNIRPDLDDVIAEVAKACHYAFSTTKKILKESNLNAA